MRRVVLLHSAIGDSRLWQAQTDALRGRFEVVAPDLPGWGEERMPGKLRASKTDGRRLSVLELRS
jgi:pimeloyl-ACP methyl ester carboxylesterase